MAMMRTTPFNEGGEAQRVVGVGALFFCRKKGHGLPRRPATALTVIATITVPNR
jgi:hypothetical protein